MAKGRKRKEKVESEEWKGGNAHLLHIPIQHQHVQQRLDVLDRQLRLSDAALVQEALHLRRAWVWRQR